MRPAAGYTTSDVPPIISISAFEIAFIELSIMVWLRLSSYNTTSGLINALHSVQWGSLSGEFSLLAMKDSS